MLPSSTEALPVRLCLAGSEAAAVDRWISSLGWQSVDADPAGPVAPALTLADVPALLADAGRGSGDVVLLVAGDDPVAAAQAAALDRVRAVVAWPDQREDLPAAAAGLLAQRGRPRVDELRVAGGAGGVGTSTVALALAGLCAWRGRRTLVLSRGAGTGPTPDPVDELDGTSAWRGAVEVPGIRGLRTLEVVDPSLAIGEGPAALVVRDLGVAREADVLVIRRDRAGLDAVRATSAGLVVVTDIGAAPPAAVRQAVAGRRAVTVPWSARVAQAGLRGRIPTGIPGSWLRTLEPVVGGGGRR